MEGNSVEHLLEQTGGFGRFQLFALLAIVTPELPAGILGMLPVFVGGMPSDWSCVSRSASGEESFFYITSSEVCECNGTIYGGERSIVSEWSLVCDLAWVSDLITSIQMGGMLAGALLGSQLSDWFGRKKTLYVSCLVMFIMSASSSLSPSPFVYAGCRFIIGFAIASYLVVGAIYPMEFFTPKWRSLSGTLGPWGEGVMLLPLFAYYFPAWSTLSWVTSLPVAFTLVTFPFLPESPRWLLEKGKIDEAKQVFAQIARWNGTEKLKDQEVENLAYIMSSTKGDGKGSGGSGYAQLICNPNFRLKILPFLFIFFSYSLVYYGISFNTKNLSGNIYLNMIYMGLIDAIAFPLAVPIINWMGRRKALIMNTTAAAFPLIAIILMELRIGIPRSTELTVMFSLVAKFCIGGGWSASKCFAGESFPTQIRSSAVGICTVAASLGGVIAPLIVFMGTMDATMPYFIFGGLIVGSACVTFFLEETRGKPIQEGHDDLSQNHDKIVAVAT